MIRFAAYGTLRKGSYNYDRFKHVFGDDFKYVETKETKGIKMIPGGSYPFGHADKEAPVVIDIIECSQECYDAIYNMEIGAGYKEGTLEVENDNLKVFLYPSYGSLKNSPIGKDWIKYEQEKNKRLLS